jgi:hypothetical protein
MSHDITPISSLSISEVVKRIINLNKGIHSFWSKSEGWAPEGTATILSRSKLDWQVSLSEALYVWVKKEESITSGELILAWANLGSLVEGTIKTLLSVYLADYLSDEAALKKSGAFPSKRSSAQNPDILTLDVLRKFCIEQQLLNVTDLELVELVQQRRNAIHAFKERPIGDWVELENSVRGYLSFLRNMNLLLPYPDMQNEPKE